MAHFDTTGLKSWTKNGQTYYLWNGGKEPVYSYNDIINALNETKKSVEKAYGKDYQGGEVLGYKQNIYDHVLRALQDTYKYMEKAGVSRDEPIFDERALSAAKSKYIGMDMSTSQLQDKFFYPARMLIGTEDDYRSWNKEDGVTKFMKFALPAAMTALTAGGLSGAIGGVSATGAPVAGSLWSPAGATAATSGTGLATGGAGTSLATGGSGTGLATGGGTGLSVGGGTGLTTTGATLGGEGLATSAGSSLATSTGSGLGLKVGGGLGLKMGGGLGLKATLPEVAMSGGGFFSKLGGFLGDAFGGPFGRLITNIAGGWLADKYTDGPFDGYNIDPGRIDDYMRKAEDAIRMATERNEELFNYRFGKAKQLIDEESGYFNPDYFAQQGMARARNMNAAARKEGLRGVSGDAAANLARKYDLDAVRGMGTAYDSGYATGVQGRLQTMTTGLQFLPNEYPNYSRDYAALANPYMDLERLKMDMAKANWDAKHYNAAGIGKLGGDAIDFGTDMFKLVGKGLDKGIDFLGKLF